MSKPHLNPAAVASYEAWLTKWGKHYYVRKRSAPFRCVVCRLRHEHPIHQMTDDRPSRFSAAPPASSR